MMTECVTLWIGDTLGPVERACLRSVLRQGHQVTLYCYRVPHGIPEGIRVGNAAEILPETAIFYHRRGSVAIFSDWFRYELQCRGAGTWIDTDLYLIAPLSGDEEYLFGEQEPRLINNAVLRLPKSSPILPGLLKPFRQGTTPQWLPLRNFVASRARELVCGRTDLARLPWGSTGPDALTALVHKYQLGSRAQPPDAFFPIPWQKADWIRDPTLALEQITTRRTIAVHLWNECIRTFKNEAAPKGSFLWRLQQEGRY